MAWWFHNAQEHLNWRCELGVLAIWVGRCPGTAPWYNIGPGVAPGTAKVWASITSSILAGMGQVRSPSASTGSVDKDGVVVCYHQTLYKEVMILKESLSILTMVSMTPCPKQLIKRLLHIPGTHVVTCLTWLSFLSHLIDSMMNSIEDLTTDSFSVYCISSTPSTRVWRGYGIMTWLFISHCFVVIHRRCLHYNFVLALFFDVAFRAIEWCGK